MLRRPRISHPWGTIPHTHMVLRGKWQQWRGAYLAAARSHRPLAASNLTACLGSARPALSRLTGRHCSIAGSQLTRKPDMLTREKRPKHLKAAALHG